VGESEENLRGNGFGVQDFRQVKTMVRVPFKAPVASNWADRVPDLLRTLSRPTSQQAENRPDRRKQNSSISAYSLSCTFSFHVYV
jgi:hypothetical protein